VNYVEVLKRALHITWNFRALWLFGFLAALFGGSGGFGSNARTTGQLRPGLNPMPSFDVSPTMVITLILIGLVLVILAVVLRAVAEVALMRLVREIEDGRRATIGRGFRLGFGRFLPYIGVSIVVGVPVAAFAVGLVLIGLSPLLLLFARTSGATALGVGLTVAMMIPIVLFLVAMGIIVGLLMEFMLRATSIESLGVFASVRKGWSVVWGHLLELIVMGVLLFGAGILWGLLMLPLILACLAAVVVLAGVTWALSQSLTATIVVGLIVGVPCMVILLFLGGLFRIFSSTAWTLIYLKFSPIPAQPPAVPATASTVPAEVSASLAEPAAQGGQQ
jgi:hypothetical protein